jgi:tRNA(fMet)-specific endonuclease VapC
MALYILDTDTLTLLRANHPEVTRRVAAAAPNEVVTSVITVDEVLTGWYNLARGGTKPSAIERAYGQLGAAVVFFTGLQMLNFTTAAIAEYDRLKSLKLNVGKNDLRIAAIALEAGAVVVTRNARDFGRVPGLIIEDWSQPFAPPAAPQPTPPTPPPAPPTP